MRNAKSAHVTATGRAKPNGKTTRRTHHVRTIKYVKAPGADRPLPLHKQCHPQALTRTPLHPQCNVAGFAGQFGKANGYREMSALDFLEGRNIIFQYGGYRIYNPLGGVNIGWASPQDACAYKIAADRVGVLLEIYSD